MSQTDQIKRAFALWARGKGIRKPTTPDGMKALFGQFLSEINAKTQSVIGAAQYTTPREFKTAEPSWEEIPDEHPVALVDDGSTVQIENFSHGPADDFEEMIDAKNAALEEFDGNELAAEAQLIQDQKTQLKQEAPFVRVNPQSLLSGVTGKQVTCLQGADPIEVARWVGDDADTTLITIILSAVTPAFILSSFVSVSPVRPFGRIKFGVRDVLQTVDVDIGQGVQLTVPASEVSVSVGLDASTGVVETQMQLSGMLAVGSTNRPTTLTRTTYLNIAAGATQDALRPAFAQNVLALMSDAAAGTVNLAFQDSSNVTIYSVNVKAGDTPVPIPLSTDVMFIAVKNNAAGTQQVRLVFGLNL